MVAVLIKSALIYKQVYKSILVNLLENLFINYFQRRHDHSGIQRTLPRTSNGPFLRVPGL